MRFDDQGYIDAFHATGSLPRIHDDIAWLLARGLAPEERSIALDVGSCTGLLSARLVRLGFSAVLGLEPRAASVARAVRLDGVEYVQTPVAGPLLPSITEVLKLWTPAVAVCRRVLPEIEESEPGLVKHFGQTLRAVGVQWLCLEGRVPTRDHKAVLWNADLEVVALGAGWDLVASHKHCRLLRRARA